MYGVLDQYQKEGYQALMKIGNRYGGAFLCDGVGLGKTFVGLMLIERLIMHDGKNVVLLVPKAANEPVWEPAIRPESPESTRSIVQARRTVAKLFADLRPITPQNTTNVAALAVFGWGPDVPSRTACEFNMPPLAWPLDGTSADDWVSQWASAFDVEKVTQDFYRNYASAFADVERLIGNKVGLESAEDLRMFTQTLFNRLMFLRFIERKGWLNFHGRHDYLRVLFQAGGVGTQSIYRSRLRPLFFQALAAEGHLDLDTVGNVPFLNGGLFEENDLDKRRQGRP